MRRSKALLSTLVVVAAASTAAIVPTTSAQAATNGLRIRAVAKTVVQGDTSRVQGRIEGTRGQQTLTIQQRSPQRNKGWGSGRRVQTDANGRFVFDRVIKGRFTRDYRVCRGNPGNRRCSLRARIEVTPRTVGIFAQTFPSQVPAGQAVAVTGRTDAALNGRTVQLQQRNPETLVYTTIGTATVGSDSRFSVQGTAVTPGKAQVFKLITPPFAGRAQTTTSGTFRADVFGFYPLTTYPAVQGGYQSGQPVKTGQTYPNAITPTATADAGTFTVNLAGNCNRFTADVFLNDATAAPLTDRMNTSVVTAIGGTETIQFGRSGATNDALTVASPVQRVDADITGAQTLRVTENVTADSAGQSNTFDPVWYANATVACAL